MSVAIPTRGRQARPTRAEIASAWQRIRAAAEAGDLQASALLIALGEGKPLMHTDGGILNLPGHGGWVGDAHDPKPAILAAIRASNPSSKQLPENQ